VANVIIPATLRDLCGGASTMELAVPTVEALLRELDRRCPGFYERVVDQERGRMRPELMFAIDGEVVTLSLHDTLAPGAELAIVPAIAGG
jgi:molybdopterin converting factor small subunit